MDSLSKTRITPDLLKTIGEIDEFKGRWEALGVLAPERLSALKRIATIESVGSSTRIEGVNLSDDEIVESMEAFTQAMRAFAVDVEEVGRTMAIAVAEYNALEEAGS